MAGLTPYDQGWHDGAWAVIRFALVFVVAFVLGSAVFNG